MFLLEKVRQARRILQFHRQRRKIHRLFRKKQGYEGNFENPRDYWEKVQFRKLYGNHGFYGRLADKVLVREYVKERVGEEILVPLLGVYERLDEGILEKLPRSFVLKVSNASNWNEVVFDKSGLDLGRTVRFFNRKVREKYSGKSGEVHYDYCTPRILAEELLLEEDSPPWSIDLFCYNNPGGFDYSICVHSPDELHKGHYDRNWNFLEGNLTPEMAERHAPPKVFPKMAEIARELSRGIDFVRVDLYGSSGRVWFGELTFTPGAGFGRIANPLRRKMRDEMWELDRENPLLYRNPEEVRAGR